MKKTQTTGKNKAASTKVAAGPQGTPLSGRVSAPGDKSISHRSLILGAMAEGTTNVTGLLEGDDIIATANVMKAFGAKITNNKAPGSWTVVGRGEAGLKAPKAPVDFGNAGTGARLIMGAAAGYNIKVEFQGDESLSSRPMGRVLNPLREMGADYDTEIDKLPFSQTKGGKLSFISFKPPHASAQVKSALLLAGLNTKGVTEVIEATPTRDHTENMLSAFGVPVKKRTVSGGDSISITGPAVLKATNINVPGDPSSAAFMIAAALLVPGSDIIIENVMMNPTRTGLFEVLAEMGAYIRADNFRRSGGETIADLHVKYSKLTGITVHENRVPSMVDEYPILAVCAAKASGTTVMRGLAELKVKESDRLAGTCDLLTKNGVKASVSGDVLSVTGGDVPGGGLVKTHHDHRLAMSALILGLTADKAVRIDDASMIATSFPVFFDLMTSLGANIKAPQ